MKGKLTLTPGFLVCPGRILLVMLLCGIEAGHVSMARHLELGLPTEKVTMSDVDHSANSGDIPDDAGSEPLSGDQPVPASRIDWHFLRRELEHGVLNMDRGILYTLRMLMFHPGLLLRDYIEGRRAGHVKPLWLLMVTAGVVVFLTRYVQGAESAIGQFISGAESAAETRDDFDRSAEMVNAIQSASDWVGRHFALTTLLLLPLEAAIFRLAFWRVKGLNYPEWLTIMAFLTAQAFVIWSCFILIGRWFPAAANWVIWAILAWTVFSLVQAFDGYPRWKTLVRAVIGFHAYALASVFVLMAVTTVLFFASAAGSTAGG